MPSPVRQMLRWLNVVAALATLASALAVLAQDVLVPGYRAFHRDALWFVTAYAVFHALTVRELVLDGRGVPWLVLGRAGAAWLFFANFTVLWPYWARWTPARYIYQLVDFGDGRHLALFALLFLGRGVFNTASAMALTSHWWLPFRETRPLLGRIVTAIPVGACALFVWAFLSNVTKEAQRFSPEAQAVAARVLADVECGDVRDRAGQTTTDVRRQGDALYEVTITWGCALTRVAVRAEDGRLGAARAPRPECCEG